MRIRFRIFGHEIRIIPQGDIMMHFTEYTKTVDSEVEQWKHDFPMDKRVHVFTQYKGFIDYVFRDYDVALMMYKDTAILHLEAILSSFAAIRNKFESKGATPEQLKIFDDKICDSFKSSINVVKNRVETLKKINDKNYLEEQDLVRKLEAFKIEDYYKHRC